MRTEELKLTILRMSKGKEFYVYEAHKKLSSEGIKVEISGLYRVMNEMLREGLLEAHWERGQHGPRRRVYQLCEKGRRKLDKMLLDAIETIHDFYIEYLAQLPPKKSILYKLNRLLDANMKGRENTLIVAPKIFYEWALDPVCGKVCRVYLIKPPAIKISRNYSNLTILDGSPCSAPLRDNFAEGIRVFGAPDDIDNSLKELSRVLRRDGVLAMVTPYFSRRSKEEPLTFAEYIEKVEHETSAESKLDYEITKARLTNFFHKVKAYRLGHLAVFIAKDKI